MARASASISFLAAASFGAPGGLCMAQIPDWFRLQSSGTTLAR
ncbi:hypothetical protein ACWGK6_13315 [Streptomyces violaceusniger]